MTAQKKFNSKSGSKSSPSEKLPRYRCFDEIRARDREALRLMAERGITFEEGYLMALGGPALRS